MYYPERERTMVFPDYYFFDERRLVSHTIAEKGIKNLDDCELMCYLNDGCVSLNFKKDTNNDEPVHICELNNATVWNMTVTWQLMPIFIIVARR